ncbi:MAG: AraC family transcriptional regulator [Clostridiales bacterium]|nr:AraC family transcriptional regulator [Clostridiales bacterium]
MKQYVNYINEVIYHDGMANVNNRNNIFFVNMCGVTKPNPKYEMFRYDNFVYVFEYVVSGSGYIDSGGSRYTVHAGDFYLLKKGFTGHYYSDKVDPYEKIWVNVQGQLVKSLIELYQIDEMVVVIKNASKHIEQDIRAIIKMLVNSTQNNIDEIQRCCSTKISDILSIVGANNEENGKVIVYSNAENIKRYIDFNIYNDISLPMIAEYMYMHESTVIRIFRNQYGKTPMKYLTELRITAAKNMLRDRIPIKNVANSLRFSDVSYFSLCFKKEVGVSPTQFMNEPWLYS